MIQKGYRSSEIDIAWLEKVYNANAWMQTEPYQSLNRQIIALLKNTIKKPPSPYSAEQGPSLSSIAKVADRNLSPYSKNLRSLDETKIEVDNFNKLYSTKNAKSKVPQLNSDHARMP